MSFTCDSLFWLRIEIFLLGEVIVCTKMFLVSFALFRDGAKGKTRWDHGPHGKILVPLDLPPGFFLAPSLALLEKGRLALYMNERENMSVGVAVRV